MKKNLLATIFLSTALTLVSSVNAATTTNTFKSQATLASSCSISANPISFGTFDITLNNYISGSSSMNITCSKSVALSINMNDGAHPEIDGFSPIKTLKSTNSANTDYLVYELFQDSSKNLGLCSDCNPIKSTGTGSSQTIPFYATLYSSYNSNDLVRPDNYSDTVTITLNY